MTEKKDAVKWGGSIDCLARKGALEVGLVGWEAGEVGRGGLES